MRRILYNPTHNGKPLLRFPFVAWDGGWINGCWHWHTNEYSAERLHIVRQLMPGVKFIPGAHA